MTPAIVLGPAGLAAGLVLAWWLRQQRYRYATEQQLRTRAVWWVAPVLALAGALLGLRVGGSTMLLATTAAAAVWMTGLAAIDLDVRRLPDRWTLPAYPVLLGLLAACAVADDDWRAWWTAVACGAASGLAYLLLALANPAGLGLGDVKLAGTLGMLTGWFGWPAAFGAFLAAFLIGSIVGVVVALGTGQGGKATFPFGPAMIAGAFLVVVLAGGSA